MWHAESARNEGQRRYALQTYSSARGRFVFDELPVGAYELQISAPGSDRYKTAFSVEEEICNWISNCCPP